MGLSSPVQGQAVGPFEQTLEQTLIDQGVRDALSPPGGGLLTVPDPRTTVNRSQITPPKEAEYKWGAKWGAEDSTKACEEGQEGELTFASEGEYGPEEIGSTDSPSAGFSDC